MFTLNEVIAAYAFGWVTCIIAVLIGGWMIKIETKLRRERRKDDNIYGQKREETGEQFSNVG